jgi:hypothetical protein
MIYKLAFSGFQDFLLSFDRANLPPNVRQQLDELNQKIAIAESQSLPAEEAGAKDLEVTIEHLRTRKSVILFESFSDQCLQKKMQVAFSPKLYSQEIWPK